LNFLRGEEEKRGKRSDTISALTMVGQEKKGPRKRKKKGARLFSLAE